MRKKIVYIASLFVILAMSGHAEEAPDLAGLQTQLDEATTQFETLLADNATLKQRVTNKESEIAEAKNRLEAIDAEIAALKAQEGISDSSDVAK